MTSEYKTKVAGKTSASFSVHIDLVKKFFPNNIDRERMNPGKFFSLSFPDSL